jgi:hypothetical protein
MSDIEEDRRPTPPAARARSSDKSTLERVVDVGLSLSASLLLALILVIIAPARIAGPIQDLIGDPIIFTAASIGTCYALVILKLATNKRLRESVREVLSEAARKFIGTTEALIGVGNLKLELPGEKSTRSQRVIRNQRREINALRAQLSAGGEHISDTSEQRMVDIVGRAISKALAVKGDTTIEQVAKSVERDAPVAAMRGAVERLNAASSTVTVRGFVNLLIGIVFALGALYVLRESVGQFTPDQISRLTLPEVAYFVGIRVSLALIITLISYFFLLLYRRSLDDSKYYQNEVTRIELSIAATALAGSISDQSATASLVYNLTERLHGGPNPPAGGESFREKLLLKAIEKLPELKT